MIYSVSLGSQKYSPHGKWQPCQDNIEKTRIYWKLEIKIKKINQRRTIKKATQRRNNRNNLIEDNNGTKATKSTRRGKRQWTQNTEMKILENLSNQLLKPKEVEENMVNTERYNKKMKERLQKVSEFITNISDEMIEGGTDVEKVLSWSNKQEGKLDQLGKLMADVEVWLSEGTTVDINSTKHQQKRLGQQDQLFQEQLKQQQQNFRWMMEQQKRL